MTKKTRILFVIENECFGGGEKIFSLLIRNLSAEKFEVYCASRPEGRFYEEIKGCCRFLPFDLSSLYDFRNAGRLEKLMVENGIDLAHSQGARADFYCGLAATAAGVKYLATIPMPVEGFDVGFLRRRLYRALAFLAARKISAIITVSSSLAGSLRKKHGRVELIPNPVDLTEFDPSNFNAVEFIERFGLRGRLVIGALGRLEWQKGYSCLIEALAIMFKKEPELREKLTCLVAGVGRLAPDLKKLADSAGLSTNIVFCGETSSARDFLGALDIFLMPSLLEGQPLALLEAMAMGKAIVATNIPGIRETAVDRQEALLVPPGDPSGLAEAVLSLVHDPSRAAALGCNARRKAETFSLSGFIKRHETVYLSVCGLGENA